MGREAEPAHFSDVLQRYNTGPNSYPDTVPDPQLFKSTMNRYHKELTGLARTILRILACTLNLPENWFDAFAREPIATLRLLHYPPQAPDASAEERGESDRS